MNVRYFLLGGVALLIGFLFYPRGEDALKMDGQFIKPVRTLDNEPLHYTGILRANPIVTTYDLGFAYKVDKVDIRFDNPNENGPKQYDILVHTDRSKKHFVRAFSYSGSSREYTYTLQSFSVPLEARWIQVVINDWFSNKPVMKGDEFRVGVRYQSHSPILSVSANYNNSVELQKLIDLMPFEDSKWIAAERIVKTVQKDGKEENEISYKAPTGAVEVTADLGSISTIYGVRLTSDHPESSVKRYHILTSPDGQKYKETYVSDVLPDDTVVAYHRFEKPVSGRYVRLRIDHGDWHGDHPELREFELFTDSYRQLSPVDRELSDYNAVQMHYENMGEANNAFAPHLVQGFAFEDENGYLLPEGGEENRVEVNHTPSQRSFAYHYDTVKVRYSELDPSRLYWVEVTYLQRKNAQRIQNLSVDGFILHGAMMIPKGKAESYIYALPSEAYADGKIELSFNRLAGPNAVVSEVFIFEAQPIGELRAIAANQADKTIGRAIRVDSANRIVIDGKINEWPSFYPMLPKDHETTDSAPIVLHTQWDDDNFYIVALINRRVSLPKFKENNHQDGHEALHLFLDTALNRSPGMYKSSDHHFVFTIFKSNVLPSQVHHHLDSIQRNIPHRQEIEARVAVLPNNRAKSDAGYILEARIPKDLVLHGWNPAIGKSIGFNYVMANLKLSNNRSGWFAYATDELNASPNRWHEVEFVDAISGRVAFLDEHASQQIKTFNAGDMLTLCVWDADRNVDRYQSESVEIELRNEATGQLMTVVLHESNLAVLADDDPTNDRVTNSALFAAKVPTAYQVEEEETGQLEEETERTKVQKFGSSGDTKRGMRKLGNEGIGQSGNWELIQYAPRNTQATIPLLLVRGEEQVSLTYIDPYYSRAQRNHPVRTSATVNTGTTGVVTITDGAGKPVKELLLGDEIFIWVQDADLPRPPNERVPANNVGAESLPRNEETESPPQSEEAGETQSKNDTVENYELKASFIIPETEEVESVKLTYQPEKDLYVASIVTAYSETPQPNNGVLQAVGMQEVWALYLDWIQKTGETNVLVGARTVVTIGDTARVEFLPTLDLIAFNNSKFFKAGSLLTIMLKDTDRNQDDSRKESIRVTLGGDVLKDQNELTLEETTLASGEFTGTFQTMYAPSARANNDVLEVMGKETVTVRYLDALQGSGETNVVVTDRAHVRAGSEGVLEIVQVNYVSLEDFNAGDTLYFRLRDEDIVDDFAEIKVIGDQLNDQETVQLFLSPPWESSRVYPVEGTFFGSIKTVYDVERFADDGRLQVVGGEQIAVIYVDELQSTGETSVEIYKTCIANAGTTGFLRVYNKMDFDLESDENFEILQFRAGDTLILEIQDIDLNTTNAVVNLFETDFVENTERDNIRVVMVEVSGSAGVFRGEVKTGYGETPIPNDDILQVQGGGIVTFTYTDALQETGETQVPIHVELSVETGVKGELEIYSAESGVQISGFSVGTGSFNAGEKLRIQLTDKDVNASSAVIDTAEVFASGNVIGDQLRLILSETEPDSAVFVGELWTQKHTEYNLTDGMLQVTDKEVINVEYIDAITATGETDVRVQARAVVLSSSTGLLRIVDENGIQADLSGARTDLASEHELGSFNSGETIYFRLTDLLLSTVVDADEVTITVTGSKTKDEVKAILLKHPEAEGVYVNSVPTRYGTAPIADDTLDVQGGEEIRAVYIPPVEIAHDFAIADHAYVNEGVRGHLVIVRQDSKIVRNFNINTPLYFRLEDSDLNLDPFVIESTNISIVKTNRRGGTQPSLPIVVPLYEEGPDSNIFRGSISTHYGQNLDAESVQISFLNNKGRSGNGVPLLDKEGLGEVSLGLIGGEIVTAIYKDVLIDTGETHVETRVNCRANLMAWAPYTRQPMLIDGHDDKWPLEKVLRTPGDEALLWLQWGEDSLYLLAQIYDDEIVVPDVTQFYEGADALSIHIDLEPTAGEKPAYLQTESDPSRYIFWICPKGAGFNGDQPYFGQWAPERIYNHQAKNLEVAVRQQADYYIIEARIPFFTVLRGFDPLKTKRHKRIGFNFVVHRSNDKAIHWAEPLSSAESVAPSDLGVLILEAPAQ